MTLLTFNVGFKNNILNTFLEIQNTFAKDFYFRNGLGLELVNNSLEFVRKHSFTFVNMNNGYFPTNKSIYVNSTINSKNELFTNALIWFPVSNRANIGLNSNYQKISKNSTVYKRPSVFVQYKLNNTFIAEYESNLKNYTKCSICMKTPFGIIAFPVYCTENKRTKINLKNVEIRRNYLQH